MKYLLFLLLSVNYSYANLVPSPIIFKNSCAFDLISQGCVATSTSSAVWSTITGDVNTQADLIARIDTTFTGDSGSGGVQGNVPAPSINQGSTGKFLNASGSFTSPGNRRTPTESVNAVSTWTANAASAANQWFGITWSPELQLFCSVSSSGTNRVQWSRDGSSWTAASAATNQVWTKIAWSPELRLFATVAFDGTTANNIMTSPDCKTWTSRTSPEANQWYDIKWAPSLSKFLAVSLNGTNRCMSSTDGITWTACTIPSAQWYSVTWSPELNLFAAVSITPNGGNYAATSPDGVTWTMRALTTGNTWYSVTWAAELGLFVAVGVTGTNKVATSPDGITWTLRSTPSASWRRVSWSPELRMLIAVSSGGTIASSPDGITWTSRTSPEANQWYDITYSPELTKFVAVGITGTNRVITSKDMGYIMGSKLANTATPSNIFESIVRRDQNGSFSASILNSTSILINSASSATNSTIVNKDGHYKSTQTTAPTVSVNVNAGTGATCTLSNATDSAGTINLTTTAISPATGTQCTVTFNKSYNIAPKCQITPVSSGAILNYVSSGVIPVKTTADLSISFSNIDAVGNTYDFDYMCVETQ